MASEIDKLKSDLAAAQQKLAAASHHVFDEVRDFLKHEETVGFLSKLQGHHDNLPDHSNIKPCFAAIMNSFVAALNVLPHDEAKNKAMAETPVAQ